MVVMLVAAGIVVAIVILMAIFMAVVRSPLWDD